ncbi:MAG: aminotransferase class III-fold pyridoxal phosphate-dependent enzyme [Ilumatobacteraceae bacterium]|jgi:adenosylmethionine-8-amino-7-oxononanoate aminotransferase|nr:aminotransferase class III-fold pyridoxal phosphate-dependent enzyme [Ilumatobacteraceae bacterium]
MPGAFLHPFAKPTRERFVTIERGQGALLWDSDGNEYVDAMASLWYCAVGHGRSEIADAIHAQAGRLAAYSCFDPFTNAPADALAELIATLTPVPDARIFLCGSGSEAIDTAIKLARLTHVLAGRPERTLVISRTRGYHGTNVGGTSAQGIEPNRVGYGPLMPDVVQVPSDDVEALAVLMASRRDEVCAVITEPVQGAGGVHPPTEGYLADVRRLCDQHGALLVFDEVITGFGRLGTWFAAQHYGVVPDLTTFAKAVTSGYQPLGGVVVGRAVRDALESDPAFFLRHGYTYSGHATACAAGLANLAIFEREGLLAEAQRVGTRLGAGLHALATDGLIDHARGVGAVWAAGLRPDQDAVQVRDRLLELGVITRAINTDTCTFCPPLVTTDEQVDRIVDALAQACAPA